MRKLLAIAAMALSMNALADFPESLPAPGEHAVELVSTWDETSQPALLFVPSAADSGEALPLLVALHGKGVDHTAWFRLTPVMEKAEAHGYVVVAPYGRGNVWYRGPGEQDVLDLIDLLIATNRIDPDRVYLTGHSMGGWGAWWVGLRNADRFASIAPMAGLPPMDLLPNALHLDPYVIHDRDDNVVSVQRSRMPVARLGELGITHRYVETTGYGHASRLIGDSLDDLFEWFRARRRVSEPKHIVLVARTPAKASNGRVHILAMESALEPAEVDVEWTGEEESLLTIQTRNVSAIGLDAGIHSLVPMRIDGQMIEEPSYDLVREKFAADPSLRIAERLVLAKVDGAWSAQLVLELPPPSISTASVSEELDSELAGAPLQDVARRLGAILASGANADAMIVRADAFAWFGAPLTPDRLADSHVSAVETLRRYNLTGEQIVELLDADPGLILAGLEQGELVSAKSYTIVSPISPLGRHETLQQATSPAYQALLRGMGIGTWE
jgi:poly(3-hydroxybutyrate) depolymerase